MTFRLSKALLIIATALHWSIVVWNNLVDHATNLTFVQHVLDMDAVWEMNRGSMRAIHNSALQHALYWLIIIIEVVASILLWSGAVTLLRNLLASPIEFCRAKDRAVQGLTLILLLFFSGFITVGGEWFMMWQAAGWDATATAARLFGIHALILLWLSQPEPSVSDACG